MNSKKYYFFIGIILLALGIIFNRTLLTKAQENYPIDNNSKIITFYEDKIIPANTGISPGVYTSVDGYKYINIFMEYEQQTAKENPVGLGVTFAFDSTGNLGARHYFNFDENFKNIANPQMINVSGKGSWHGKPHNRSSYIARFPVMGPYIDIFPFNKENKDRKITIKAYLTK